MPTLNTQSATISHRVQEMFTPTRSLIRVVIVRTLGVRTSQEASMTYEAPAIAGRVDLQADALEVKRFSLVQR
jgi:hypothetical protein